MKTDTIKITLKNTVTKVKIKKDFSEYIKFSTGIRQEDPLSQFGLL
jgi:hypothetical protein